MNLFDKNPDGATVGVVFQKFIAALREYNNSGRTLEELDEHTCLTLIISIINLVADLLPHLKICDKFESKGHVFTSHQKIDAVLKY